MLGATAPLAACALFEDEPPAESTPTPPRPDDVIREEAVAAERLLLAEYAAVVAAHPGLATDLSPFVERHERHVAALLATTPPEPEPTTTPGQQTTPAAEESPRTEPTAEAAPPAPDDPAEAIRRLRDAEADAVPERLTACLATDDGRLAGLLAGIAACEASHDQLLAQV